MADYITKIRTTDGDKQIDYRALANLPELVDPDHKHVASDITSGTINPERLPVVPVAHGGTEATTAEQARENLGITLENLNAANAIHQHDAADIIAGTLDVQHGGTGASIAAEARTNLGFTGGITTAISDNFKTNRAIISNDAGKLAVSTVTSTELGYLDGVNSNIQTQLNGKSDSSHTHRSLTASDGAGTIILGNETNSNGGSNYYFRPNEEGDNDVHFLGTSSHPWDRAYIDRLTLTNYITLNSNSYGTECPAAGNKGRIFFKKVSS